MESKEIKKYDLTIILAPIKMVHRLDYAGVARISQIDSFNGMET